MVMDSFNQGRPTFRKRVSLPFFLVAAIVLVWAQGVAALELWSDDEGRSADLRTTLKLTGNASANPSDPWIYPNSTELVGMTRLRFGVNLKLSDRISAEFANEHGAQRSSHGGGVNFAGNILSSLSQSPWRVVPLDWQIARDGDIFNYRHEIDRASVTIKPDWGLITVGRQAIGFGRGLLFSAVDIFAPFSPLEVDRDWRRGVDALRLEYQSTPTSSLELITVVGRSWDDSALLGRFRGYVGDWDGEIIAGKRGEDAMFAGVLSAALGGASVHSELALFHTPEEQPGGGLFGNRNLTAKLVLGGSYTFNVGNGLTFFSEYHYSGFGLRHAADATQQLFNKDFIKRFLRGDSQILGQHDLALQLAYPINETLLSSLSILESLTDASGIAVPSLVWSASDTATVTLSAFFPWGPTPRNGVLRSEFGAAPFSLFAQLSLYF